MSNKLSCIIPMYNEEENVYNAVSTIANLLEENEISNEIIVINDGSYDATWNEILRVSIEYNQVRGISFSRNFGKESAIMAGLENVKGDCCVVLDGDLQHPPEKIIEMYDLWKEGYEVIEGVKDSRGKENFIKAFACKCFYGLISKATGYDMRNSSDFKLLDRKAIDAIIGMKERGAFFRALSSWIGFKRSIIYYDVQDRKSGETKWSNRQLVAYAVKNITSFSTNLMQVVTVSGIAFLIGALILGFITLVKYLNGQSLEGFTTVILIILIANSIIMISLGIIGYYLAKIYDEIKCRPRYIISERCGKEIYSGRK